MQVTTTTNGTHKNLSDSHAASLGKSMGGGELKPLPTECCKKHGRWTTWKGCKCIQHHRSCPECGPRRSVSVSETCILVPTFRDRLNHMAAYSRRVS